MATSASCASVITDNIQTIPNTVKEKIAILVTDNNGSNDILNALQAGILLHDKEYVVFEIQNKSKDLDSLIAKLLEQEIMYATICDNKLVNNKKSLFQSFIKPINKFFTKYSNNNIQNSLEDAGIFIIHPNTIIGTDVAKCGLLTTVKPSPQSIQDIASGIFIFNNLCRTNTGQSVISQLGKVIGIEKEIENTKHLIQRCINSKLTKNGGVLVKLTKPKQRESLLFPTIDSNTIIKTKEAKLEGIVINANYCRIIDINNTIALANKNNIFILSI